MAGDPQANRTNLAWLLRLRWGAIAGQALTIACVHFAMAIELPLGPLFTIVAIELASNLVLLRWARARVAVPELALAAVMAGDVLLLTGLLYFAGGPFNPFNSLYVVHIALAAVVLRSRFTWALLALSFACFGALFLTQAFAEAHLHHGHAGHSEVRMHLYGMWVAFGVAAVFIAYFVTRVTTDLGRREQELFEARSLAARSEQLAALATLAAGAAHELSTPLSTIAVAAKELDRTLGTLAPAGDARADAQLIRDEVARCREILARMATEAGPGGPEEPADAALEQVLAAALSALPGRERIAVALDPAARACRLGAPPHALTQALRCVLQNAQHAVARSGEVSVTAAVRDTDCVIEVRDTGTGMTPEVRARAGEPFFTTKEPGRGMGLGLFVSRAALERAGGTLSLRDNRPRGTVATLRVPIAACGDVPHGAPGPNRAKLEVG